jgi:hypothetical protein
MDITISKRYLSNKEIDLIIEEIKKFPNPVTIRRSWQRLNEVYVAVNDKELAGVCGITKLKDWTKVGPFVVFEKYQNQGLGKKIFTAVLKDYPSSNLYVGSRNLAVARIVEKSGFYEVKPRNLPTDIKICIIRHILENLSIEYLKELIRKKPTKEGPFRSFLRPNNSDRKL